MLSEFLIFYAPFIMVIISIVTAFWLAAKDNGVENS